LIRREQVNNTHYSCPHIAGGTRVTRNCGLPVFFGANLNELGIRRSLNFRPSSTPPVAVGGQTSRICPKPLDHVQERLQTLSLMIAASGIFQYLQKLRLKMLSLRQELRKAINIPVAQSFVIFLFESYDLRHQVSSRACHFARTNSSKDEYGKTTR
jgi:hypothetical protein